MPTSDKLVARTDELKPPRTRRAQDTRSPGRITRLLARLRSRSLDRALSDGADEKTSARLAARAAQLTARPMREELAGSLEQLLYAAHAPAGRYRVPLRRTPILVNGQVLREIASDLHGPAPVSARGVAMLHELLTDGTGPLFMANSRAPALAQVLGDAQAALFAAA
jgi:hypothetical protein